MGPYEQNQQKSTVVLLRGMLSLDGINELFVGEKRKKLLASSQTDYCMTNFVNLSSKFLSIFKFVHEKHTVFIKPPFRDT